MKNLVILCGGVSPEHEISLRSTKNILEALDKNKYSVQIIGISKSGSWFLQDQPLGTFIDEDGDPVFLRPGQKNCFSTTTSDLGDIDVIFPVLHGPNGEDGSVQGLIQVLDIPHVGPGVLSSAISMDKDVTKRLLKEKDIQVADWITIRKEDKLPSYDECSNQLGKVVFVKPANMGSSVGVTRASNEKEFEDALETAFEHDTKILVEECLTGRELECAVLGNESPKASGVGEVRSGEVYSYEEKYDDSSSAEIIIPAEVKDEELENLRLAAIESYKALECKGLSRVDMFLTSEGNVYVNEVNTIPGFTSISMYPKLWEQEGVSYTQLLDELIELAIVNHK